MSAPIAVVVPSAEPAVPIIVETPGLVVAPSERPPVVIVTDEAAHVDAVRVPDAVITALGATYLPQATTGPVTRQLAGASDFAYHHSLGYRPPVRLIDAAGLGVEAGIEYPSPSDVYVQFPTPFTGTVLVG